MTLYYTFVIFLAALAGMSVYAHFIMVNRMNRRVRSAPKVAVMSYGRKINAFTIERVENFEVVVAAQIGLIRYYWMHLKAFFGVNVSEINNLIEHLKDDAIAKLSIKAKSPDYLMNLMFDIASIGRGRVAVVLNATAIYLFEDTLGLINVPHIPTKYSKFKFLFEVKKAVIIYLCTILALLAFSNKLGDTLTDKIVNNFTIEDEKRLWSYYEQYVLENEVDKPHLIEIRNNIQEKVDQMPITNKLVDYTFKVHVIDEPDVDIVAMPYGHILIYRGLFKEIKSYNALIFLIAHELGHYESKDHIKGLGQDLIGMYLTMKVFGDNAWLAKFFVYLDSFFDIEYSQEQEIEADQYAILTLEGIYGHVGGVNELRSKLSNITEDYNFYLTRHPVSEHRIKEGEKLITTNQFQTHATIPLNFNISDKAAIDLKVRAGQFSLDDKFLKSFTEYEESSNKFFTEYNKLLENYVYIMDFATTPSLAEINHRLELVSNGSLSIDEFKTHLAALLSENEKKIMDVINSEKDSDKRNLQKMIWQKERYKIEKISNFYFTRDKDILNVHNLALNFLSKRNGRFIVNDHHISFTSNSDNSNYNQIISRIDEIIRRVPPITDTNEE